jgi:hypothetical protein
MNSVIFFLFLAHVFLLFLLSFFFANWILSLINHHPKKIGEARIYMLAHRRLRQYECVVMRYFCWVCSLYKLVDNSECYCGKSNIQSKEKLNIVSRRYLAKINLKWKINTIRIEKMNKYNYEQK